jgi:hypothetical protein
MTEIPTDLVVNRDLRLAYSPALGKLWRTNAQGAPIRELVHPSGIEGLILGS